MNDKLPRIGGHSGHCFKCIDCEIEKDLQELQAQSDKKELTTSMQSQWSDQAAYATDAYRMLANSPCLSCHQVPSLSSRASKYPSLGLSAERLRPDWMLRWLASPQRMMIYPEGPHPMPANFPRNDKQPWWTDFAVSAPDKAGLEKSAALRDILMDLPKVAEMPANRYYRAAAGETK